MRIRRMLGGAVLVAVLSATMVVPASAVEPRGTVEIVRVRILDFRFRPASLSIDRGTVVKWKNRGAVSHTSTSDGDTWDSGTLSPGETFRRRFRRTGTFAYHCEIHPAMTATIVVG